jgi:hypothetical protein
MLMQGPSHDIPGDFIIDLLQVKEDHMQVFLLFHVSLYKLPYKKIVSIIDLPEHKTKLVFSDVGHSL